MQVHDPTLYGIFLILIIINLAALQPVLEFGPGGDNGGRNSLALALAEMSNTNLWGVLKDDIVGFMSAGRLFPLASTRLAIYYLVPDIMMGMKIFLLSIFLCMLMTGILVRSFLGTYTTAAVPLLLFHLYLQIRPSWSENNIWYQVHDPLVWGATDTVILIVMNLISILFFWKFLIGKRKLFLALSIFGYVVCLLFYEATYFLWIIYVSVALSVNGIRRLRQYVWSIAIFPIAAGICVALTLILRHIYPVTYPGIFIRFDVLAWSKCLIKQVYAQLPLTYFLRRWVSDPEFLRQVISCWGLYAVMIGCLCSASFFLIYKELSLRPEKECRCHFLELFYVGLGFLVIPAAILSISSRWQDEIFFGVGYNIPLFFSYVGGIIIGSILLIKAMRAVNGLRNAVLRSFLLVILASVVGLICSLNYIGNRASAETLSSETRKRLVVEKALSVGLMNKIPNGASVISELPYSPPFLWMHAKKMMHVYCTFDCRDDSFDRVVNMLSLSDLTSQAQHNPGKGDFEFSHETAPYVIRTGIGRGGSSFVIIGRVIHLRINNSRMVGTSCDQILVFVSNYNDCSQFRTTNVLFTTLIKDNNSSQGREVTLDPRSIRILTQNQEYQIMLIESNSGQLFELDRTNLFFGKDNP